MRVFVIIPSIGYYSSSKEMQHESKLMVVANENGMHLRLTSCVFWLGQVVIIRLNRSIVLFSFSSGVGN